jgi:hypothetical protein
MPKRFCAFLALALAACAPTKYRVDFRGRHLADLEPKGAVVGVTAYGADGRRDYESDYEAGCKGNPTLGGHEVPGSAFRYDREGNILSHWDIDPDTAHARYSESWKDAEGHRYAREFRYRGRNLDSLIETAPAFPSMRGEVRTVYDFGGTTCIHMSWEYFEFLHESFLHLTPGSPFIYDTLVMARYDTAGALVQRFERRPDSLIDSSFGQGRVPLSLTRCGLVDDERCERYTRREWFKTGKPSAEEADAGGGRRVHRHWYENGQLMTESFYKGTKLDGIYRSWHENGRLNRRIEYAMGAELRSEEWDAEGKPVPH